jgi:soluble lytic murein transglycosylase-like protein
LNYKQILILTGALSAVLGLAVPASAQIYSWRDEKGTLVVSDKPRPGSGLTARSFDVPRAETVRATRYVAPDEFVRAGRYDDLIDEHSRINDVRSDLVRAVIQVESAFNPYARSPKGAMGLMQLMPDTARMFGVINPFNPIENIRAGVRYLRQLLDKYSNNEVLALAAYNAGPKAVDRHGEKVPPYRETRTYVSKVNRLAGPARPPATQIFRSNDVTADGRVIPKYTDKKPQ